MKVTFSIAITLACIAALAFGAYIIVGNEDAKESSPLKESADAPCVAPSTYADLIALSPEELEETDIARMNLLCAQGLPGAEELDIEQCLATLDLWAAVVRTAESRYIGEFYRNPGKYDGSLAKFRAVNLVLTLKQDLKCGYNLELVKTGAMADIRSTRFFRDSRDLFLHGFTQKRQGSCSSLPVLVTAIGHRCGMPIRLVSCKGHLFCRWDDGQTTFNIETTCGGVDSKPDSYYTKWPYPTSATEVEAEGYLKSLTPQEELGIFASLRAFCLQENGRYSDAGEAFEVAAKAFPKSRMLPFYLAQVKSKEGA